MIVNGGDIETFPKLTISGPGTNFSIARIHSDERESLDISQSIAAGESIVVDMSFGIRSVEMFAAGATSGTNIYHTASGTFWPLGVGGNTIEFDHDSAGAQSALSIRWNNRYLVA